MKTNLFYVGCTLLHPIPPKAQPCPPCGVRDRQDAGQVLLTGAWTFLDVKIAQPGGAPVSVLRRAAEDPRQRGNGVQRQATIA